MRKFSWLRAVLVSLSLSAQGFVAGVCSVQAGEITFIEDFALAADRAVPLKSLVPGTEDFYYFHCLHAQQTEQFDKVPPLVTQWVQRLGHTARVNEILARQALLTYDKSPQQTLEFLRNKLGVHFPHQKEQLGVEPNLPTAVDPNWIARATLMQRAFQHPVTNGFEDSALDWLINEKLDGDRRRHLISRLQRPDYATLTQLIMDDFGHPNSGGFGQFAIHKLLTQAQLEDMLKRKPDLIHNHHWVVASLTRLQPGPDEDWQHDSKSMSAYLDRLEEFTAKLPPVQNPLKAQTLYHRLWLDRSLGQWNKEKFIEYLKLPRPVGYLSKSMREGDAIKQHPAHLNADLRPGTLLPPVANDEPLVRSYLQHFLVDAPNAKDFEPYIDDTYLKHLFAETKILNGLGEPEQWAAQLPAGLFAQLKQRVEIEFDPTNRTTFAADEPVSLNLHVKNVGTMIVKVFEINTRNYYTTELREVDTDVNLDGLVANRETTHNYNETPFRRMRRRFEFAELTKPGVYVVDFIGNGRSSRALIRKGKLKYVARTGTAGQVFTILDEKNQQVKDARLLLGGQKYKPGEDGTIIVPFTHRPGRQPIVIVGHEFACLDYFNHEAENFALRAGMFVDRESLISRRKATVVIRPQLSLNGTPVSTKLLEEVRLQIVSTDLDGVPSSTEIPNFKLFEDRESTHEFNVPARLQSLQFVLRAKVQNLSANQKVDVVVSENFAVNGIEQTDKIEDLHLVRTDNGYFVELLGKTGEPKVSRPVQVLMKHRDFRDPVHVVLKSDKSGRVSLGHVDRGGIVAITATGPEGTQHAWPIRPDEHIFSQSLHGRVGEVLTLPFLNDSWRAGGVNPPVEAVKPVDDKVAPTGGLTPPARQSELSLLEIRGDGFSIDRNQNLSIKDGLIQISNLPAGDFDLWIKPSNTHVRIRIAPGEARHGYVLGQVRQLETRPLPALQIEEIKADKDTVVIQLRNVSKFARVHLFADRFVPAFAAASHLGKVLVTEPYAITSAPAESVYLAGRNIGDEYRYIIDRKYAKKYPGNSLELPSLLLNPWAVRTTETGEQIATGGDEFQAKGTSMSRAEAKADAQERRAAAGGDFANLDFLAESSVVLMNLVPDENGRITIKREQLGTHQQLHVVAVDPINTTARSIALPEPAAKFLDLRLTHSLDPKQHFTQQKQISIVNAGQPFAINDITTSKFEAYDSLGRAFLLFTTLTHDPKLAEFQFILNWPKLKPEEQRAMYSKFACHELNIFLRHKDRPFFDKVVRPYLANKKDKTFVDLWLLESNLDEFGKPWSHNRLNIAERVFLTDRNAQQAAVTARHVSDLFKLQPPNVDRFLMLFDTAVKGSALEVGDAFGLKNAEQLELAFRVKEFNAPASEAAAADDRAGARLAGAKMPAPSAPAGAAPMEQKEARKSLAAKREMADEKAKDAAVDRLRRGVERDGKQRQLALGRNAASDKLAEWSALDAADFAKKGQLREEAFFESERLGAVVRQLYRKMDPTKEWAENNYYQLLIAAQTGELVTVSPFWRDYAAHIAANAAAEAGNAKPFLSTNLAEASRNFTEMMLALAVLDLPFEPAKHESKFDGPQMTLAAGSPMIVFHEEIKAAKQADKKLPILVSQNFFKHGDRHRVENGEQIDKYVTDEFVIQTVYGCQVVVTNPTSARQKLTVLLQVPQGAISVANGQPTKSVHVDLQPYHTQTIDYFFYFPAAGQFPHFPIHAAKNGELIAFAAPTTLNVVDKPTKIDTQSWDYVSQHASADECLEFLRTHNVHELNLERMAWRMHDPKFFDAATKLLAERHAYHHVCWSYGLKHNAVPAIREFLQHSDPLIAECGGRLNSPLVTIDPIARHSYEHLDYKPLVNARAHRLGQQRQIVNARFFEQYQRTLQQLAYSRTLDDADLMAVTYYLLLQDRIEEAQAAFARVNPDRLATRLQYDYFTAYLDFFNDDPKLARAVAAKYADHPVERWRLLFNTIKSQLDEIDGAAAGDKPVDLTDRNQEQTQLAATQPNFDFTVEAKQLTINHQNLDSVRVAYYLMDVELLFSRNPFVQQFSGQFSLIRPNQVATLKLNKDAKSATSKFPLPAELHNKNVLVEITGAGQTKTQAYYSNSLAVQVIDTYGQVKVTHATTGKPIPKTYVKVYAQRPDGSNRFYKDGYTDLRGRFDYASLNTNDLDAVTKFSILVMSDDHGAIVKEANPPKQ